MLEVPIKSKIVPEGLSPLSVSSFLKITDDCLSNLGTAYIEGEISELKSYRHLYFKIKDENSSVDCVMWSYIYQRLDFTPKIGDKVVIVGKSSLYKKSGQFSVEVQNMELSGFGVIMEQLRLLKEKLQNEGVFSKPKRKIPRLLHTIGVITSADGKAIHDIVRTLKTRNDGIKIIVYDARVQGDNAARSLIDALDDANLDRRAEVLIIGRGGGSFEDLLPFSDESLVRAVANSYLPIISAVGHEPDVALTDFAADVRASTPTQAAQIVSQVTKQDIYKYLDDIEHKLNNAVDRQVDFLDLGLENLKKRLISNSPFNNLKLKEASLNSLSLRISNALSSNLQSKLNIFTNLTERLYQISPKDKIHVYQNHLVDLKQRLDNEVNSYLQDRVRKFNSVNERLNRIDLKDKCHEYNNSLNTLHLSLNQAIDSHLKVYDQKLQIQFVKLNETNLLKRISTSQENLSRLIATLSGLNPLYILQKGYSITKTQSGKELTYRRAKVGDIIKTRVKDAVISSQIIDKQKI